MILALLAFVTLQQVDMSFKANPDKLDKYWTELVQQIKEHVGKKELSSQILLTETYFRLGQLSADRAVKREHFQLGEKVAEESLKTSPESKELKLLWIANRGEIAGLDKNLKSLFVIPSLESELLKITKIDPNFSHAAAHVALGKIYLNAPSIISVGSKSKAEKHIQQAFQIAPDWPANRMAYAELLLENKKAKDAAKLLEDNVFQQTITRKDDLQTFLWQKEYQVLADRIQREFSEK